MADSIPSLRKKLDAANAEIERLKQVQVIVDRIVYVDNPAHIETIRALQDRLSKCQEQ